MANETRSAKVWASIFPEATYNTPPTTGADYEGLVSAEILPGILPGIDKTNDAGRVGTGTDFATHTCNQNWRQPNIRLANDQDLFTGPFGKLWLRGAGGPVVDADTGVTGKKHTAELQNSNDSGRQLPGTSLIYVNGVDDFLLAGMVVASASLSKQGADAPSLAYELVGTGKHDSPNGVSSKPAYVAPTVCADGGSFIVKFTNAASEVVDLSAVGCQFKNLNVALNNNLKLNDRCPGDPKITRNLGTASHVRRILRQYTDQRLIAAFTFVLENLDIYKYMTKNEVITSVTIAVQGPAIAGGTASYEIGVEIPKATIIDVTATDVEGEQGFNAAILPLYDSGIDNGARFYVINTVAATLFK